MLTWYLLVGMVTFFLYFQNTMIIIFGFIVEQDLLDHPIFYFIEILCVLVLIFDMYMQINTAYLSNGMIVR